MTKELPQSPANTPKAPNNIAPIHPNPCALPATLGFGVGVVVAAGVVVFGANVVDVDVTVVNPVPVVIVELDFVDSENCGLLADVVDDDTDDSLDDDDDEDEDLDGSVVALIDGGSAAGPPHGPPVAGSRYQLLTGSSRHSPTVTNSKLCLRASSMTNCRSSVTDRLWFSWSSVRKEPPADAFWATPAVTIARDSS